jgi:hypothetical protein
MLIGGYGFTLGWVYERSRLVSAGRGRRNRQLSAAKVIGPGVDRSHIRADISGWVRARRQGLLRDPVVRRRPKL